MDSSESDFEPFLTPIEVFQKTDQSANDHKKKSKKRKKKKFSDSSNNKCSSLSEDSLLSKSHFSYLVSTQLLPDQTEMSPVVEESTKTGCSATSSDILSLEALGLSLENICEENHLQEEPFLRNPSNEISRKSIYANNHFFRKIPFASNSGEEDILSEGQVFQSNFPFDDPFEAQQILKNVNEDCASEDKLKQPVEESCAFSILQNNDGNLFQEYFSQNNTDYDWDKFLEKWEGAKPQEPKIAKNEEPESLTSKGTKRKLELDDAGNIQSPVPLNGHAKKKIPLSVLNPTVILEHLKLSGEEQSSNRKCVLPSYENEMDLTV